MKRWLRYGLLLALTTSFAAAQVDNAYETPAGSNLYVVLIGGINKDPEEIRSKDRAISRLGQYFIQQVGVDPANLAVLAAPDSFVSGITGASTKDGIAAAFSKLQSLTPNDRLVIYFAGQANIVGDELRLNIPGPDLTHAELAALLAPLNPGQLTVVLDCPGAGLAAEALAGPNRILIYSARSDQPVSTRFSDYFVPALMLPDSDVDGNGTTTLLEAFQYTVQQIDTLFRDQNLMKSENALLEDNGDATPSQQPWSYQESGNDGAVAATVAVDTWDLCYTATEAVNPLQPSTEEEGVTP